MDREEMLELIAIATENMTDEELTRVFEFIVNEPVDNETSINKSPVIINEPNINEPNINESNTIVCKAPDCDIQFIPTHNLNTYCSKRCSDRVRNKKQRERRKKLAQELRG